MFNVSIISNLNPVKINNISKLSFKGDMQNEDSFVKSSDEMKKSWKYLTPVRNPIVRQQFEKHFSEDTHYLHDGSNGEWFIKDEKKGNDTIYYAAEKHPARVKEIRVFGKKGNIVKNSGVVAKTAKLTLDKESKTYISQPVNVKTKEGVKSAVMRYEWIDEQSKMFLKSIKLQEAV